MRFGFLAAVAIMVSSPAMATTLWHDIEAGMPAARVKELYPEVKGSIQHKPNVSILENVQQVGRCHPDVLVRYTAGAVSSVEVRSRYRGFPKESCSEEAEKALISKYGTPKVINQGSEEGGGMVASGPMAGMYFRNSERTIGKTWLRDGVLITFEHDESRAEDTWTITYELKRETDL